MNVSHLRLGTKLLGGFAIVLLIALVQGLGGVWLLSQVNGKSEEIRDNWLPSVVAVSAISGDLADFRNLQLQHVLASDAAQMDGYEKEMAATLAALDKNRKTYVALISSPEERAIYERLDKGWAAYLGIQGELLKLSRAMETENAQTLLNGPAREQFVQASKAADELVDLNRKGGEDAAKESEALYRQALWTGGIALAVMMAVGLALGWRLSRQIAGRVTLAREAAEAIAQGRLDRPIQAQGGDELAELQRAMQAMQRALTEVVGGVRHNAESVATASAQIAQGNQDLSQRTEEQASALEQTAAAMDELGSTVRHNADNAQQASQLARTASEVAVRGGEVVGQVVDTMKHIQDSSRRISDIIGVIDGIAFQTNILALNAAVEAARAGEQGRGFAVVAGEVRTLAQRSADAAREIKTLISSSVERVEQGNALVTQAGDTMRDVVASIQRVNDIVAEISSASREQSAGVGQIGQAVSQMDHTTQQNAALVEESAAAAESLRQQAHQLVQAVAVFRLSGDGQAAAHRPLAAATAPAPRAAFVPSPVAAPAPASRPAEFKPAAPAPATTADDDWTSF
jgi:methyl-accepting chemotaxis protein